MLQKLAISTHCQPSNFPRKHCISRASYGNVATCYGLFCWRHFACGEKDVQVVSWMSVSAAQRTSSEMLLLACPAKSTIQSFFEGRALALLMSCGQKGTRSAFGFLLATLKSLSSPVLRVTFQLLENHKQTEVGHPSRKRSLPQPVTINSHREKTYQLQQAP